MDKKTEYTWTGKQNIYGQENKIYMDRKTE